MIAHLLNILAVVLWATAAASLRTAPQLPGSLSGAVGYPRVRFAMFSTVAGMAWAANSAGIGYAGGVVFRERPLIGVAVGIGLAIVVV